MNATSSRAAITARVRRLLRGPAVGPVDRALALVAVADIVADHEAIDFIAGSSREDPSRLSSAERVLDAALEHLNQTRATQPIPSTGDGESDSAP